MCSHEIAASTAQLVAASKVRKEECLQHTWLNVKEGFDIGLLIQVKADKDSANLHRLQQASRGVTQATAAVVASTKSGKSQIEETGRSTVVGPFQTAAVAAQCKAG